MSNKHRIAPDHELVGWPSGVKYIVGNEGAERFSFYGMKAILFVYLTVLIQASGLSEQAAAADAKASFHLFVAGVYAFPVLGAILADKLLGKYQTIIWLSLVYCAGHAAMAVFDGNLTGTYVGLALIAVGAGGIKPCVSAHVGDQFGKSNWHLINKVFQAFYFIINFGSFFAILTVPILNARYGPTVAFGVPGILMGLATFLFWLGRHEFVHLPANPGGKLGFLDTVVGFLLFVPLFMLLFASDTGLVTSLGGRVLGSIGSVFAAMMVFGYRQRIQEDDGFLAVLLYSIRCFFGGRRAHIIGATVKVDKDAEIVKHWFFGAAAHKYGTEAAEGPLAVFRIISVFFLVSVFWMLFDQTGSSWIEQAKGMDLSINLLVWKGDLLISQINSVNPIMVMALIPVMTFGVFPLLTRMGLKLTPLRKMSAGMIMAGFAYVTIAMVQDHIDTVGAGQVSVMWQLVPYFLLTLAEVLVSVTGLEFAYTQAPKRMKSIVMSFWLLCVSFGNWFVAQLAHAWADWDPSKTFWTFAVMMFAAGALFTLRSLFYTYKEYPQE